MKKKLVQYQRSVNSPWVTVPDISPRSAGRFVLLGVYYQLKYQLEDGSVEYVGQELLPSTA